MARRSLIGAAAAMLMASTSAFAADARPIEWVVGFAAGGGSDVVARTVAEGMAKELNQTIVVVNKPGASTNIAADYVAKTKDAANTMLTADFATLATNPHLYNKLSYSIERDFSLVGMLVRYPLILVVHPSVPAKDFKEFLAWARAQKEPVTYATPGSGTPHHLATELLREATGLRLTHVPYRGGAPAMQDVIGGQVPFMLIESTGGLQHIASGRVRALAVANGTRMAALPDVATLQQQGVKNFEAFAWQGLAISAAAPAGTAEKYNRALVASLNSAAVRARLQTLGAEPLPGTAAQMLEFTRTERERWGALIRQLDLKAE